MLSPRGHVAAGALAASLALAAVLSVTGRPEPARADTVRDAQQPVLRAMSAPRAWQASTGSGVTVAVLDSGVDGSVRDLAGSVTTGPDYTAGADPAGYTPPRLHGTYIASLIAGHGSGPAHQDGVIGIAPSAHVLAIRVLLEQSEPGFVTFNDSPRWTDTVAEGIRYAIAHGAEVINMSLGEPRPASDEEEAIKEAISHGIVVVAAAGNSGAPGSRPTPFSYPASVPGVVSVAAVTVAGRHAFFSDHNASVMVSAPGVGVVGAGPHGEYLIGDGTSQATGLVSGVAALIRAKYPALPPEFVARAIIASTTHRPAGGYDTFTGFGEVNAAAAVRAAGALTRYRRAGGLNPVDPVGGAAARAPVAIVRHDGALVTVWAAVAAGGVLGFIAVLLLLAAVVRRDHRARPAWAPLPGTWPVGGQPQGTFGRPGLPPPVPPFTVPPGPWHIPAEPPRPEPPQAARPGAGFGSMARAQPEPPYGRQPDAGQPDAGLAYPAAPSAAQPYPAQPYPAQQYPAQQGAAPPRSTPPGDGPPGSAPGRH